MKVYLTGSRKGQTCKLPAGAGAHLSFVDGVSEIPDQWINTVGRYLVKCYQVSFTGEEADGPSSIPESAGVRESDAVSGDGPANESGATFLSTDDGTPADAGGSGGSELSSPRDGQEDSGSDNEVVRQAIAGLDPNDDQNWTRTGKPSIQAVSEASGIEVTRAELNSVAGDLNRDEVRRLRNDP